MNLHRLFRWGGRPLRSRSSRIAQRFPVSTPVLLALNNGTLLHGLLHDMSIDGALLLTREHTTGVDVGEEARLSLANAPEEADNDERFHCTVVRIASKQVAIRFLPGPGMAAAFSSQEAQQPGMAMEQ